MRYLSAFLSLIQSRGPVPLTPSKIFQRSIRARYGGGSCNPTLRRMSAGGWSFIQLSKERSGRGYFDLSLFEKARSAYG